MWKRWSPSRKLAAVVLLVGVVVAGAAAASSSSHDGSSSASASNSSGAAGKSGGAASGTGQGGKGSSGSTTTMVTPPPAPLPIEPTVQHTTGLHAGDEVTISVKADKGSQIFAVEMRMCRAGSVISNGGDWLPTVTGQCASKGLSPGTDGYKVVSGAPPFSEVTAGYKVGTGTDTYKMDDGTTSSVTCDSSHPCVLAVKYQIPNGFGFRTYPLTFS